MTTLCKAYSNEVKARQAAEALRAAGVPGRDIRILTGHRLHDVREEPAGGFAGPVGPYDRVGTFAGVQRKRRQGAGTFAGDADRQRQGSFADADRDVIVSYEADTERSHVAGDLAVRQLLRSGAEDRDAAEHVIDELRMEHAAVLAQVSETALGDARARLDELARTA